jgi:hypothetical protein
VYEDSKDGTEFKNKMIEMYPDLDWMMYLEVSASQLYNEPMPIMEG